MKAKRRDLEPVILNSAQARRIFTDREEPRQLFAETLKKSERDRDSYQVLSFYGRGGIGKSRLLRVLMEQAMKEKHYCVFYDMEQGTDQRLILTRLRNMLTKQYPQKFTFDLFDLALLRYSELAGETNDLIQKENKTIIEGNPVLSAIFEGAHHVPGASVITDAVDLLTKGYHYVKDISEYSRQTFIKKASGIEKRTRQEILDRLPEYFSEGLAGSCDKLSSPLIIFLDAYEKLVNYMRGVGIAGQEDRWLRNTIIQYAPNSIWVIAGRDKLRWQKIDDRWKDADYSSYLLGNLGESDAVCFLESAGIADRDLCRTLFSRSDGDPLTLDLYINIWQKIVSSGNLPRAEDFSVPSEVVVRYLQNMDSSHKAMAELLACFGRWTDGEARDAAAAALGTWNAHDYDAICSSTLVQEDDNRHYYMQRVVREAIRSQMPARRIQTCMAGIREAVGKCEEPGISVEYISYISDLVDRLVFELKSGVPAEESVGLILKRISRLQKQGDYPDVMSVLMPVYSYEEMTGFKDLSVYPVLWRYLNAISFNDQKTRYLEETQKLYDAYRKAGVAGKDMESVSSLLISACTMNLQFDRVLELTGDVLAGLEASNRKDKYYTDTLHWRGVALYGKHRYADAIRSLSRVLDLVRKEIEEKKRDQTDIKGTLYYLAAAFSKNGDHARALELYEEDMDLWRRDYKEDYPHCLQLQNSLALENWYLGNRDKAVELWKHGIEICSAKYGESYMLCLGMMGNLANVYKKTDAEKALELHRKVFEIEKEKYPPGHPNHFTVYNVLHNIALDYGALKDYQRELETEKEALEGFHQAEGLYHPESFLTVYSLVLDYKRAGDKENALRSAEEAEEIIRRHPNLETRFKSQLQILRKAAAECR